MRGTMRLALAAAAVLSLLAKPVVAQEEEKKQPYAWWLKEATFHFYDPAEKRFVPAKIEGTGRGRGNDLKKWEVSQTGVHIEYVGTSDTIDFTWSAPPLKIPANGSNRVRVKGEIKGKRAVSAEVGVYEPHIWDVDARVVPPRGDLTGRARTDYHLMEIPAGTESFLSPHEEPDQVVMTLSGIPGAANPSSAEFEMQFDWTYGSSPSLYFRIGQFILVKWEYRWATGPVAAAPADPKESKGVSLDRTTVYPGSNIMLKGNGLVIGEECRVELLGEHIATVRPPQDLNRIAVHTSVSDPLGFHAFNGAPRDMVPNKEKELQSHEWIWVRPTASPQETTVEVSCSKSGKYSLPITIEAVDVERERANVAALVKSFMAEIPPNPYFSELYMTSKQPLLSKGGYNNMMVAVGRMKTNAYSCGGYQGQTLALLNSIRFNEDPEVRKRMDGVDYGPFQSEYAWHHFAAIWPIHASNEPSKLARWQKDATILDPWPEQRPQTFPISSFWLVNGPRALGGIQPDDHGPAGGKVFAGAYPINGGAQYPDPFIPKDAPARASDPKPQRAILIRCPVNVLVTDQKGRRLGIGADGKFVNELSDENAQFFANESANGADAVWQLGLPEGKYRIDVSGTGSGTVHVMADTGAGALMEFEEVRIEKGQSMRASATGGDPWKLTKPDGTPACARGLEGAVIPAGGPDPCATPGPIAQATPAATPAPTPPPAQPEPTPPPIVASSPTRGSYSEGFARGQSEAGMGGTACLGGGACSIGGGVLNWIVGPPLGCICATGAAYAITPSPPYRADLDSMSADYRQGFQQGYQQRVKKRRAQWAFVGGTFATLAIWTAGAFIVSEELRKQQEEDELNNPPAALGWRF